jgi:hypothetical protein
MDANPAFLERLRAVRMHQQHTAPDFDGLVGASIGLHSTDYATPYLSAWARLPALDADALFDRLNTGNGLFRVNAMRNTVHVILARDLPLVLAATGAAVGAVARRSPGLVGRSEAELGAAVSSLCEALADGPRSTNELKERLPALAPDLRYWMMLAMAQGYVLRADAPHLRSNRTRYVATRERVPGFEPGRVDAVEARRTLLLRAVDTFGPLTVEDLAWWLPAPKSEVKKVLASAGSTVAKLEVDGATYWFPAHLADGPSPPREALGAWLLPYEDAFLKGYLDRAWVLSPGLRPVLFPFNAAHWAPPNGVDPGPGPHGGANVSGEARPSIWWAGRVVGRWEQSGDGVAWQLHADVGSEGRSAIEVELGRLERFLARTMVR